MRVVSESCCDHSKASEFSEMAQSKIAYSWNYISQNSTSVHAFPLVGHISQKPQHSAD